MFNVSGVARATNLKEVSPRLIVGSVYCSKKLDGDNWQTTFIKCKLVGNALTDFITLGIKEKDQFIISKAIIETNKYTNKEGNQFEELVMTIFEVDKFEPKEETKEETKSKFKR